MAFNNKIRISFCGFKTQKDAEDWLEGQERWFKQAFDWKLWAVESSVTSAPDGWRVNFNAEKDTTE